MPDTNVIGDDFEFQPTLGFVFTLDHGVATLSYDSVPAVALLDRRSGAVSVFHHTVDTDRLIEAVTQYRIRKAIEADRASRGVELGANAPKSPRLPAYEIDEAGRVSWPETRVFYSGAVEVRDTETEGPYLWAEDSEDAEAGVPLEAARLAIEAFDAKHWQETSSVWDSSDNKPCDGSLIQAAVNGETVQVAICTQDRNVRRSSGVELTPDVAKAVGRKLCALAFEAEQRQKGGAK